jgi:hypothetical protein
MDELTPDFDGSMEVEEGVLIDNYIDGVLDEELRMLLMKSPIALLPVEEVSGQYTPMRRVDGSGRITLDASVLRPISLQMMGWSVPVTRFIDERHPLYELQFSRYTRGGVTKPVAVYMQDGMGNRVIDYFSLPATAATHHIQSLQCVCAPEEGATSFILDPMLVDALCYHCAAAVYNIMGNKHMSDIMLSRVVV